MPELRRATDAEVGTEIEGRKRAVLSGMPTHRGKAEVMNNVLWGVFQTGAGLTVGFFCGYVWPRLRAEMFKAKREFQKDLITRLTARRLSLVLDPATPRGDSFSPPQKWQILSPQGHVLAASIHWQRAAQIALDGIGPAPGCDSCRGDEDAVVGKPYAICQNCGRTVAWNEPIQPQGRSK